MSEKEKQKVLIVHNYYQIPGGEDTVVANEKKLLEDHGHEVVMYTRHNNELKNMSWFRKALLPFTTIFNPRTYIDVKKIIREKKIDIVHIHNTLNLISPSVYYAAKRCGVPVIQTIHNFRLLCPGATFYRDGKICEDCISKGLTCAVKNGCYRGSKFQTLICVFSTWIHRLTGIYGKIYFITLTEFNKEKLLLINKKRKIIDCNHVFVKPNFTFEISMDSVENEDDYYLFIGRIEELKGVGILLDAFKRMPDKRLRLAGTGTKTEIEKYMSKAPNNVSFLGFQDRNQLSRQLAGAKAVIVSSQCYETFGMIIVEAYAARKPVIAGNIGNIGILVEDGITGVKFLYDDAEAIVEAIDKVDKNMGENGYRKYEKEFCPEANYKKLLEIYEALN